MKEALKKKIDSIINFVDTPEHMRDTAKSLRLLLDQEHLAPRLVNRLEEIILDLELHKENVEVAQIQGVFMFIEQTEKRYNLD